ncbi:MAG: ATP synthase epsilon chain [Candidatus Daviesbacteria bacterium GW2011_GWA2_38_24]|uniref:ATP synthase epsilon chain n=1 Tax=Candidatus Daviesbacteria bacterium GW2011_GWA2_38_24 TaxID=1618422 RepID=A0A0G0JFK2_9BACT|nr:MAG: ATP synthase epsilon chain [Candidatus Daviesbacteria bacterium GW2011_GWA2_38_24]OGE24241.1 MAG: ATP synthase F1 subunit epsilon [Candidatus Daviesbacteria bacterium RIFCSPHIGHO2_01_FULL_38_8]
MSQINLKVVTPERLVFEDIVDMVTVPAPDGPLGILPHHISLMSKVSPGELQIKKGGKENFLAVGEGIVQVAGSEVIVMTDLAKTHEEIDEAAVEEAKKRAQEALTQILSDEEYATTLAALDKSLAQLKVKRRRGP